MKVRYSEFIIKVGNEPLPDVFLFLLAKHYLSERDCISLAISGASDRFSFLFWTNRKRLAIGHCNFLSPMHCNHLFQKHFSPLSLTTFDASHCHWIPAEILVGAIVLMHNLEELSIHDTRLTLAHLLRVFKTCKNILKLSFNLYESNLDAYQKDVDSLTLGFGRLTRIKIVTAILQSKTAYPVDAWPVTLEVLSWCHDCVDLHIEIAYPWLESLPPFLGAHNKSVLNLIRKKFKPLLSWIKSLESLVIIYRGNDKNYSPPEYYTDPFVLELLDWMFIKLDLLPRSLKRLWIREIPAVSRSLSLEHFKTTPFVNALNLWIGDSVRTELNHPKFNQMEQLGGIHFTNSLTQMTQLKFAIGRCVDDHGLSEFCRDHSNLEHLYFDTAVGPEDEDYDDPEGRQDYSIGDGNWTLASLKTLGYSSIVPQQDVMDHLIKNCPSIEILYLDGELPLDYYYDESVPMGDDVSYLSRIQFHSLTKLSLAGFEMLDGNFLIPMVKQCPKLQILHIGGLFTPEVFLSNLGECLPLAKNLRDFWLEWERKEKSSSFLLLLEKLLDCSDHLERLVLFNAAFHSKCVNWSSTQMEHVLVQFATVMERLVALCFAGFRITPSVNRQVNQRLAAEVVPLRPSFWFYIGRKPPPANDISIPRIYYDGIIDPVVGFRFAPSTF